MKAEEIVRKRTGLVVPACLPEGDARKAMEQLLHETVRSCLSQVADPSRVCIAVDGEANGADAAQELGHAYGVQVETLPQNLGKLNPCRAGAALLLRRPEVDFVAIIDQDSDHFANEIINFVRAAEHIRGQSGDGNVLVIGRRASMHRSLGFARGEEETLADRILMDALAYHAAVSGDPLRLEFCSAFADVPDFHSGYKLFSRAAAEATFCREVQMAGVSEACYWRHAPEAVMSVEPLLAGARLGVVNRSGFNEQPVSLFGRLDRAELVAGMIVWPCKRLSIPPRFVLQWLSNRMPELLLATLRPDGREELSRVRELVLQALAVNPAAIRPCGEPLFL